MKKVSALHFFWLFFTLTVSGYCQYANAQGPPPKIPIPVEYMIGNNRMYLQAVVKRKFSPDSKFGFLSVPSFAVSYDNNNRDLDMAMPVVITYTFYKGFGLVGGMTVNNRVGYAPLVGAQHSFANKKWVAVTIASALFNSTRGVELFGIYEYKPSITPKLGLYNRVQFLYVHNTRNGLHARSFLQLRTGLKMKALNVGVGANLDQYGPEKTFKPNYGLFASWDFQ